MKQLYSWSLLLLFFFSSYIYLTSCTQLNFIWTDVEVKGQLTLSARDAKVVNTPEDFFLTNSSIFLANTYGTDNNRILEFDRDSASTSPYHFYEAVFSIAKTDSYYLLGTNTQIVQVSHNFTYFNLLMNITKESIYFTGFMVQNQTLLYVSLTCLCQVAVYNLSNFKSDSPQAIYGGPESISKCTNENGVGGPSLGYVPRKTVIDCSGSLLWVADPMNGRIVAYPIVSSGNSSVPQIILGQSSVNSTSQNLDANTLVAPTAIAFSQDCSVMFVSDRYRVVRYRAPYSTGQAAEGMLGFSSFSENFYNFSSNPTTNSTMADVFAIQFEDFSNGTGKLYILDRYNNRLLSGITSTAPLSTVPLYCNNADITTCNVGGTITVSNNQTLQLTTNSTELLVNGNITLSNASRVILNGGQIITSIGSIQFSGTLIVTINSNTTNVTLFTHNSSAGQFNEIQIIDETGDNIEGCKRVGKGEYRGTSMSVIITQECEEQSSGGGQDGGVNKNVIIGVVVGVVGFAIMVIVVVVVVGVAIGVYKFVGDSSASGLV